MRQTTLLFLEDNNVLENKSIVITSGTDEEGSYFVPEETCFYYGGGGQEPDKGVLIVENKEYKILKPKIEHGELRHYLEEKITLVENQEILIKIDEENRFINNKLHSAGHLISSVVTQDINSGLITAKGMHFQQGAFVGFSRPSSDLDLDINQLNEALQKRIEENLPITIKIVSLQSDEYKKSFKIAGFNPPVNQPLRLVKIGDYMSYPCGGTHVNSTIVIGNIHVSSIKNKKGNLRVYYSCLS